MNTFGGFLLCPPQPPIPCAKIWNSVLWPTSPPGKGLEPRPDAGVLIASGAFALAAGCLADGKVAASG